MSNLSKDDKLKFSNVYIMISIHGITNFVMRIKIIELKSEKKGCNLFNLFLDTFCSLLSCKPKFDLSKSNLVV